MVLNNLWKRWRNAAVAGTLITLLSPVASGCGDVNIYNNPSPDTAEEEFPEEDEPFSLDDQCAAACSGKVKNAAVCLRDIYVEGGSGGDGYRDVRCLCEYVRKIHGGVEVCQSGYSCCTYTYKPCVSSPSECK